MVIATIHQPSVEVFYLFDKLQLLGAGRSCFEADVKAVDTYFADNISPTQNPADVVIYEAQREPDHYAARWANDRHLNILADPEQCVFHEAQWKKATTITLQMVKNGEVTINSNNDHAAWCNQFCRLLIREVMALYRDFRLSFIRILQILV